MTLYAVLDKQGKMCSDACVSESAAWKSACKQDPSTDVDEDFKRYRAGRLEQGYRIAPVGCYNTETQVVVDRDQLDYAQRWLRHCMTYHDQDGVIPPDEIKQFLEAGKPQAIEIPINEQSR